MRQRKHNFKTKCAVSANLSDAFPLLIALISRKFYRIFFNLFNEVTMEFHLHVSTLISDIATSVHIKSTSAK